MKHRDFKVNGERFSIVESNNSGWKWQVMTFSERYNGWIRTTIYGNSITECKELTKDKYED